jgi:hypothetical protein
MLTALAVVLSLHVQLSITLPTIHIHNEGDESIYNPFAVLALPITIIFLVIVAVYYFGFRPWKKSYLQQKQANSIPPAQEDVELPVYTPRADTVLLDTTMDAPPLYSKVQKPKNAVINNSSRV